MYADIRRSTILSFENPSVLALKVEFVQCAYMVSLCQRGEGTLAESQAAKAMTDGNRRLYALCGVVAPIFFVLMVQVEHLLIPSFSWMTQQTSDMGAWALYGSYAILQNVNFVIFGILVIAFAVGFRRRVVGSRAIAIPLGLFGVAFFLLGIFPDQPMPWPGVAHDLISWVGGVSLLLAQFYAWRKLRHPSTDEGAGWTRIAAFSLVCFVAGLALLIVFITFGQPGSSVTGILQSASAVPLLIWLEVMALRLLRLP